MPVSFLVQVVQQHPPRDESQQKISELEQKLKKLSEKRNQLQQKRDVTSQAVSSSWFSAFINSGMNFSSKMIVNVMMAIEMDT